ncbi:MAG: YggS family pyridoxal phosphate-dependent enzyme [Caulobacterales bacterium]|nr:YggS family pyridoxal phosphate-dependent enzyme [Caulobacterales bacterium]
MILEKIKIAAKNCNRDENEITLVAACKTQNNEIVENAINFGQKFFGENRVQEGIQHFAQNKPNDVQIRLIGPLQSNKTLDAMQLFDVIETLDRPSLVKEIVKLRDKGVKTPEFLIQVNIGEEPQKAGVLPRDFDNFLNSLRKEYEINPIGLMCIPPNERPSGPYFALLAKMAKNNGLSQLSMGMSGDFETAIKFGATHIRVGTALFGER